MNTCMKETRLEGERKRIIGSINTCIRKKNLMFYLIKMIPNLTTIFTKAVNFFTNNTHQYQQHVGWNAQLDWRRNISRMPLASDPGL